MATTVFLRLLAHDDKPAALAQAVERRRLLIPGDEPRHPAAL